MKKAAIFAMAILLTACHPGKGPAPAARQPASAGALAMTRANQEFSAGAYAGALKSYGEYLSLVPTGGQRDEALFRLGLIHAMPGDSRPDWQRATGYLSQLVAEFPSSPHRPAAELILALRKEATQLSAESQQRDQRIKQLSTELERLIRIDTERR
jgi:TolA-binding protein